MTELWWCDILHPILLDGDGPVETKGVMRDAGVVDAIVGVSNWARQIRADIASVAADSGCALITGPAGSGKELIARTIHAHSSRAGAPFVPVDCSVLTGDLLISQMFGHVKGELDGAPYESMGAFRAAGRGTIFLAEVDQLDRPLQQRVRRVIDNKAAAPLGGRVDLPIEARVIAATRSDPRESVRAGRLNQNLFERLSSTWMEAIPLAERLEDIGALASHFLCKLSIDCGLPLKGLAPEAMDSLLAHDWPGNVRELFDLLELAVIFTEGEVMGAGSMPELIKAMAGDKFCEAFPGGIPPDRLPSRNDRCDVEKGPPEQEAQRSWPTLAEVERNHILRTLSRTDYNQSASARCLGIDRNALRRKIKDHGLDVSRSR